MVFRVARHTTSLEPIIAFYINVLGLEIIGSFENHSNYDGVFLGLPGVNWHLEFTVSDELPEHVADEDDLLVFYTDSHEKYVELLSRAAAQHVTVVKPKNPYWLTNGTTLLDPDGYRVVVTYRKHGK